MKTKTSNTILDFIERKLDPESFQNWLFESNSESDIGEELYSELIQIDYSSNHSRIDVNKLVEERFLTNKLHYNYLVELLNQILIEESNPLEGIETLNGWAEKGYTFLGQIELIGNYGEQGKSIVYDLSADMPNNDQYRILNSKFPQFKVELAEQKEKLDSGKIHLNGKSRQVKGFGKIYEYEIR